MISPERVSKKWFDEIFLSLFFRKTGKDTSDGVADVSPGQAKKVFASILEEDENDEVILRPPALEKSSTQTTIKLSDGESDEQPMGGTPIMNKRLRNVQSLPYFSFRPASENDIFSISGNSMSQISMTPEIPSISYSTLPKNYEDTPNIEKYKESISLYSIQTANSMRAAEFDFSMPRYFRKVDFIAQSAENVSKTGPKKLEKSKRLKLIRNSLPPLTISISKERSKEKNIEWSPIIRTYPLMAGTKYSPMRWLRIQAVISKQ